MKALVTGAAGFLGRYVAEQLAARGDQVRALCRQDSRGLDAIGAEVVRADLRDRPAVVAACRDCEVVFHVGGRAGIGGRWKDYYEANVLGTRHVVEGCLRARRRPPRLYQQPQRHLRWPQPGGHRRVGSLSQTLAMRLSAIEGAGRAARAGGQRPGQSAVVCPAAALDLGAARPASGSTHCGRTAAADGCAASAMARIESTPFTSRMRPRPICWPPTPCGRARRWPAGPISSARANR